MDPSVLAIAATDGLVRAGLLVDILTIREHGLRPLAVVTAITAQDDAGLVGKLTTPVESIRDQFLAIDRSESPASVKMGALTDGATIETVHRWLVDRPRKGVVLDPVLTTSAGGVLLEGGELATLRQALLPHVDLLTPNLPETERLVGASMGSPRDVEHAAKSLLGMGVGNVLIKGGHAEWLDGADLLAHDDALTWLPGRFIAGTRLRGSGCRLSTSIACGLATGLTLLDAVDAARRWLAPLLAASAVEIEGPRG
ncbi:MAG: hydroxymethylpyrimidine/phosphomethylpyrimidine kinase [Acidobacteriota bacterium]|nr:hydroxymethylpyrimidine/phosphomethylpyrimidine kinase [Acidobacteriota bacterium]MDH3786682.1 hydroxymethylpyrimidine/phosphomethylpyrimidine kinase [Acidobacteriota bacterium]